MSRIHMSLFLVATLAACNGKPPAADGPPTTDTDTAEPDVLQLPGDTSIFIPQDTGPTTVQDLSPQNWVYILQQGFWNVSPGFVDGQLTLQEYIDELDTAVPAYECNVVYQLTGSETTNATCGQDCDLIFDVQHAVTNGGDPSTCHDPDAPQDGETWQLAFSRSQSKILFNYHGTDVWLDWYDATEAGTTVTFNWAATLAIEVEDTGMTN